MGLNQKQFAFSQAVAQLIQMAHELGYDVLLGEAWRPPEMAKWYANRGLGIENSLHLQRLAIDLTLFKDGVQLTRTEDYRELGEWWEQCDDADGFVRCWGGRFSDGNHFSFEHNGVR